MEAENIIREISTHKAVRDGDKINIYIKGFKDGDYSSEDELIDSIPADEVDDLHGIFDNLEERNRVLVAQANEGLAFDRGGGIYDMENSEMFKCFTALENDLISSEFAIENKVVDNNRNLVCYFREENFSDVEKQRLNTFLEKYTDKRVKPEFCKVFERFEIKDNNIYAYVKDDIYSEGGGVNKTKRMIKKVGVKAKELGSKFVKSTKKAIHDKKKNIALDVLHDTKKRKVEWDGKEYKTIEKASDIVEKKYVRGGEIEKDISKKKKSLISKAKSKGIYENFGQKEVRQLEDKYGYTKEVAEFDNWSMNYDGSNTYARGGGVQPENVDLGDGFKLVFNDDHSVDVEYNANGRNLLVSFSRFENDGFSYEDDAPNVPNSIYEEIEQYEKSIQEWEDAEFREGGTVIKKGNRVRVVNTQFDGKEGLVVSNDLQGGKYQVQIEGKVKGFPFENLMLLSRETYAKGGGLYEVNIIGEEDKPLNESMMGAKNLTELKERVKEKYGTTEGFRIKKRSKSGAFHSVKFDEGGSADLEGVEYIVTYLTPKGINKQKIFKNKDLAKKFGEQKSNENEVEDVNLLKLTNNKVIKDGRFVHGKYKYTQTIYSGGGSADSEDVEKSLIRVLNDSGFNNYKGMTSNEYKHNRGNIIAVLGKDNTGANVYLSTYTPNTHRFLGSTSFDNPKKLAEYFDKNQIYKEGGEAIYSDADLKIVKLEDGKFYQEITINKKNQDGINEPIVEYVEVSEKDVSTYKEGGSTDLDSKIVWKNGNWIIYSKGKGKGTTYYAGNGNRNVNVIDTDGSIKFDDNLPKSVKDKLIELYKEIKEFSFDNWKDEAIYELREEQSDRTIEIIDDEGDYISAEGDSSEFIIFENEDKAEQYAIERVKEDLDENPEYFDQEWLSNYIDAGDFFKDAYTEWDESYAHDIKDESSSDYPNRLIEEMVESGLMSEEEASTDGAYDISESRIDTFVEMMVNDKISEGNNGYDHYKMNFGEEQAGQVITQHGLINIEEASKDAISVDGIAHFIAGYDHETIYLPNGIVAYRTN